MLSLTLRRAIERSRRGDEPLLRLAGEGSRLTSETKMKIAELADDNIPVARPCRVLHVPTSGYHDWLMRAQAPRELHNKESTQLIRQIYADSRGRYGSPRIDAQLRLSPSEEVTHKRVGQRRAEAAAPDQARPVRATEPAIPQGKA
ncbi:IS3 family transposase [Nonomuraea sp. NPDC003709]|uniref:IS3 family transposase n=1 Tax=Nonomuraea sp. NPDC003709 TaxID=3154450 RepID=UPI0033BDE53B